jgi:S-disulfanyl-L-cysteine oxidoreductase SoxD
MKFKLIVALTSIVLMAGCAVSTPGRMETSVMTGVKHRLTVRGKNDRNPLPPNADVISAGKRNFGYYCFSCHGLDGQNTGVPFADRMSPPVPALTSPQVQSYTDGQLKWIIEHGISPSGMPASQGILNDEEIWQIIQYVRHLPPKGSLGEPPAYSGK